MAAATSYMALSEQLGRDLQSLASESKRRSSDIKHACDKSVEILKRSHSEQELMRHPDFIDPFVSACLSGNAKLTSISMQSMQRISGIRCVNEDKIDSLLNALIKSTELAIDIQLKVLQLIPILFKTYADIITDKLLAKLFLCCTQLLPQPNRTAILIGTASATLQQLVNEVFDRCKDNTQGSNDVRGPRPVAVSNDNTKLLSIYRYDAHVVLANLSQLNDPHIYENAIVDVKNIPEDCGLEILEFVLSNHASSICEFEDLLFLLRTKVVPLLLRTFSSSKSFPIVVRTARCVNLLISIQFFDQLELESEIMLWLLIHTLNKDSDSPTWKKILSLEIFDNCTKEYELIAKIFKNYDNLEDRKDICISLLGAIDALVHNPEFEGLLGESDILAKGDTLILSPENSSSKISLLGLLDKSSPPLVDQTYFVYLLLSISNNFSDGVSSLASLSDQKDEADDDNEILIVLFEKTFPSLFEIHRKFLHSTTLDSHLFHLLVRAFQKLSLAAGIFGCRDQLHESLTLFKTLIVANTSNRRSIPVRPSSSGTVLGSIGDTLVNVAANMTDNQTDHGPNGTKKFHSRVFHQRNLNLFRALISLSISLGSSFDEESWRTVLVTWQWVSYYVYGPTADFLENYYGKDVVPPTVITRQDLLAYEASVKKFIESSANFTVSGLTELFKSGINCSKSTFERPQDLTEALLDSAGNIRFCPYNRSFFVAELADISISNYEKILSQSGDGGIWSIFNSYLISQIANRDLSESALRLYLSRIYSDTVVELSARCNSNDHSQGDPTLQLQGLIMKSLLQVIDAISALPMSSESIYSNDINVESDIILQVLKTLNDLLDSFGETLTSWDIVLKILNSPFNVINNGFQKFTTETESNISQVILKKHKDMIQMSFEVFKLISDNFLHHLPLNIIKVFIDTLFNFVNQNRDLNISFSSISQFWLIADSLRMHKGDSAPQNHASPSFDTLIEEKEINEIIEGEFPAAQKLKALLIYLLISLVRCAFDLRPEVKNGAVQTFFGILDSNFDLFPSWDLIASQTLTLLLQFKLPAENANDYAEFVNITFKGLLQVYSKHLSEFHSNNTVTHWTILVSKMGELMHSTAYDVVFSVCVNFKQLLEISKGIKNLPVPILSKYYETWSGFNIIYTSIPTNDYRKKTNSDCLQAFMDCFKPLYELHEKYSKIDISFMEKCLGAINATSRYPLLPDHISDKLKPSPLQDSLLHAIATIEEDIPANLQILVLAQLSAIVNLPFDTRDRIEKKLSTKLGDSNKAKIPSFEAISYSACQILLQRITKIEFLDELIIESKAFGKLIINLSHPMRKNSMISPAKDPGNVVLWKLACDSFCLLSEKLFEALENDLLLSKEENVCQYASILIETLISTITKDGKTTAEVGAQAVLIYKQLKKLLTKCLVLNLFSKEQIQPFCSALWSSSYYYEIDEVEDAVIKQCTSLEDIVNQFSKFDFDNIVGSTKEPIVLPNYSLTSTCLEELINFCTLQSSKSEVVSEICFSFMIARVAFVLRKFVADQQLLNLQPISKVKSFELQQVSKGILDVLSYYSTMETTNRNFELLHVLYPLLLKAIPLSRKVPGLQDSLLQIALLYARLNK
ncbi:unnamed protein product [Kluyveromyces dobzhanskii CBS 2104]|uniref:WGS project CCBQ000000000 data, contig 00107 n=1 Tax=Kluyveromyces dobzhanskii CBS 2104 TaxID=1427455 RepID=A0A0A8L0Y3_9SACH|nr:unnamed protein product [Kluyveromyces dobzhanskii CBS 2104]